MKFLKWTSIIRRTHWEISGIQPPLVQYGLFTGCLHCPAVSKKFSDVSFLNFLLVDFIDRAPTMYSVLWFTAKNRHFCVDKLSTTLSCIRSDVNFQMEKQSLTYRGYSHIQIPTSQKASLLCGGKNLLCVFLPHCFNISSICVCPLTKKSLFWKETFFLKKAS